MSLEYITAGEFTQRAVDRTHVEKVLLAKKVGRFLSLEQDDEERRVVEGVAKALAADVSAAVREALAFELRRCDGLSKELAEQIARDIEDVACPFLADTTAFTEEQLAEIVTVVDEFALVAIARRRDVPEQVALALSEYGGERSITSLVRNPGAKLSEQVCGRVIDRFPDETRIMDVLSNRQDLPLDIIERLVQHVSDTCRKSLVEHYNLNGDIAHAVTDKAADHAFASRVKGASSKQMERYVRDLHSRKKLTDDMILSMATEGNLGFFELAMSLRVGVPLQNVRVVVHSHLDKGLGRLLEKAQVPAARHQSFATAVQSALDVEALADKAVTAQASSAALH